MPDNGRMNEFFYGKRLIYDFQSNKLYSHDIPEKQPLGNNSKTQS